LWNPMTTPARPTTTDTIPALVNPGGGSADASLEVLRNDARFALEEVPPDKLAERLRELIESGATRVAVSGGDGTIATAAAALADTDVELAVIPGGTLNHLARDHDIPTDPKEAAELAATGAAERVDIAEVNGKVFLNTSSVGAYVTFVRARERREEKLPYRIASLLAAVRVLFRLPRFLVHLKAEGEEQTNSACLVFVGVGERDFEAPKLGARKPHGQRGLHIIVVKGSSRLRLFSLATSAVFRGLKNRVEHLDTFIVDKCRIDMPRPKGNVATDGEISLMRAPLEYRVRRDALRLVVPSTNATS
jgi:diacylglycerol kinase family enzyme